MSFGGSNFFTFSVTAGDTDVCRNQAGSVRVLLKESSLHSMSSYFVQLCINVPVPDKVLFAR